MRKIRVRVDEPKVEPFETKARTGERGTVRALADSYGCSDSRAHGYTCDLRVLTCHVDSCDGVCGSFNCTG